MEVSMSFLILFMVRSIDPFGVAVALICGALAPRWWQTPLVGIVVAAGLETGLTLTQVTRVWGETIIFGAIISTVHALIGYGIGVLIRRRRA